MPSVIIKWHTHTLTNISLFQQNQRKEIECSVVSTEKCLWIMISVHLSVFKYKTEGWNKLVHFSTPLVLSVMHFCRYSSLTDYVCEHWMNLYKTSILLCQSICKCLSTSSMGWRNWFWLIETQCNFIDKWRSHIFSLIGFIPWRVKTNIYTKKWKECLSWSIIHF